MADHTAEIENCPPPQDIKQLQRFLGMVNFYCFFLSNVLKFWDLWMISWRVGLKCWSGPLPLRRLSKMLNASWRQRCHSNTLPQMLNFLSPLTPLILRLEGSCSKNLETPRSPLVFFLQANRHRIMFFNIQSWITGRSGSNKTFLSLLRGSYFPTLDRPQTPCSSQYRIKIFKKFQRLWVLKIRGLSLEVYS